MSTSACRDTAPKDIDVLIRAADLDQLRDAGRDCGIRIEALPMTFSSSGITVHRFTKFAEGEAQGTNRPG